MIIDAHAHIFRRLRGPRSRPVQALVPTYSDAGQLIALRAPEIAATRPTRGSKAPFRYTDAMLLADMRAAGVDGAVLLQGPAYGEQNRCTLDAARRNADRFVAAAYIDPWDGDAFPAPCTAAFHPGFCAAKIEFSDDFGVCHAHPDARLNAPELRSFWRMLAERDRVLTLDLGAPGERSYQTAAVRRIAESNPELRIVICHLAKPTRAVEAKATLWRLWLEQIGLAKLPNVWFDTAALPALNPEGGPSCPYAARYLKVAMEEVGPDKLLWGTDYPTLLQWATYPRLLEMAREHTGFLSSAEQRMFLGENALHVYRAARDDEAA